MYAIDDDKMKLYNFLFDEHPNTNDLLQYIGFTKTDIPRFKVVHKWGYKDISRDDLREIFFKVLRM